jgi:hypothetical protein
VENTIFTKTSLHREILINLALKQQAKDLISSWMKKKSAPQNAILKIKESSELMLRGQEGMSN